MSDFYDQYTAYLESDEWKKKRLQRLAIDNYTCQFCGSHGDANNPLETHHFTYKNLFHENVYRDVVTACRCCHEKIHCGMNRVTNEDGRRGWSDELPAYIRAGLRMRGLM